MSLPLSLGLALAAALGAALPPTTMARAEQLQDDNADALRLLPAAAVFALRMDSLGAALELVNRFRSAAGSEPLALEQAARMLPCDATQLETGKPLWVAVSVSAQAPAPLPTFVLPARDAQALLASLELDDSWRSASVGEYVGVSQLEPYALAGEPSPLGARLRPGLAALHLDLAVLIETYRPFIEMGLDQAEMQFEELSDTDDLGLDFMPLFELYIDLAWDLIDSAAALDVALAQGGGALELQADLAVMEQSPMAALGAGPPVDLKSWPAQVDASSSLCFAAGGDWALWMKRIQPLMDATLAMYPEGSRTFMQDYLAASQELYPLMGPAFAAGEFGEDGVRMSYLVRSERPAELCSALTAAMQLFTGEERTLGIGIAAGEGIELGGVKAQRFRMTLDHEALARATIQGAGADELSEGDLAELEAALAVWYGKGGLSITSAPLQNAVAVALGGDEAFARSLFAGPSAALARPPADFQRALDAVSGGSTGLVYRLDLPRMMGQIADLSRALGSPEAGLELFPEGSLPTNLWMSIRGSTWSGGASVDFESLLAFVSSATAAAESRGDSELQAVVVEMELGMLVASLELYAASNEGRYPSTLEVLAVPDENGASYLDEVPLDPWGNAYVYEPPGAPGGTFRLLSWGADGAPGGEGAAADIDSASLRRR